MILNKSFMEIKWIFDQESINWDELSSLHEIAPLGDKKVSFRQHCTGAVIKSA